MSHVLVLSPHPDDESIGCGGTLRKHVVEGDIVHVVFLTSGEKGGHRHPPERTRRLREAEARRAARILGVSKVEFWRERDGKICCTPQLVRRLRARLRSSKPDFIYLPHDREMHPDHRATGRVLRSALRGAGAPRLKAVIRMFEVWTPLQRLDDIVDISRFMKRKVAAIRAYRTQCEVLAFDEAMIALNRYRGEMHSWPGGDYAEAFAGMRI